MDCKLNSIYGYVLPVSINFKIVKDSEIIIYSTLMSNKYWKVVLYTDIRFSLLLPQSDNDVTL